MRGVFRINLLCSARNYSDGIFSCVWVKDKRARTSDLAFSVFVDYSAFRGGGGGGGVLQYFKICAPLSWRRLTDDCAYLWKARVMAFDPQVVNWVFLWIFQWWLVQKSREKLDFFKVLPTVGVPDFDIGSCRTKLRSVVVVCYSERLFCCLFFALCFILASLRLYIFSVTCEHFCECE